MKSCFLLASTIAMYMFSPTNGMFRIGQLASMGLLSALITDFTVIPIVIQMTKPFGREAGETEIKTEDARAR